MNGYFQLINAESGMSLKLIPPTDGGESINMNEVMDYLSLKNIVYDLSLLSKAIAGLKEQEEVILLNTTKGFKQQEMFQLVFSIDKMEAVARFYPPSSDGELLSGKDIVMDLQFKKVSYGVIASEIEGFLRKREYCKDIVLARGKAPRYGRDANIEYFFTTDLRARPTLREDGSVDFFNLNTVNHCKVGDVLAELTPEDLGEYGQNVFGEKVRPKDVKSKRLQYGRNIAISEDKLTLTSEINGHVTLVENKVFVTDVLEVENVDIATGNIDSEGSVQVNGNVCNGFTVKAKGNVDVKGVVEGAHIESGGNIIIARGMNGMGKGVLKAEGNVIAKFIENATVSANGYVECGSILYSNVTARTEIHVGGKKGFITGGVVCATNLVDVKTLGSPMGGDTTVDVGVNPATKRKYQELQKQLTEANKAFKSMNPILLSTMQKLTAGNLNSEQMAYAATLSEACEQKKQEIKECTKEIENLEEMMGTSEIAQVIVREEVYPGTKVVISDVSTVVKQNMKACRFIKRLGDVKMTGI